MKRLIERIEKRQLYREIYRVDGNDIDEVKDYLSDNYKDFKDNDFHIVKMKLRKVYYLKM